ncbi:hypothetical protein JQ612_22095 [Bradyrhizobium manausense]|uniref:hypothetical protein n=1 Tax=Bradyrhizobium manausense TaxID=989370 RepID=UPI001BA9737F|nr:hypothetical protein [Bradyrhizobium manausense]MBR0686144.1 hypothetical protein [Bradyrhizobium manausense]MBR0835885.1 hypothetical protein [Bradyrhizobium manausense]
MTAVLEVYDERRPGAEPELRHRLELPTERMTARELIRCRIEADVALHNAVERARLDGKIAERDAPNGWLVTPGPVERALNGPRDVYGPGTYLDLIESEPLIAVALEAFARNGFFMILDGHQIVDLDEVLTVGHDSTVTFLRLVPLVGG